MTLGGRALRKVNSPQPNPKLSNSTQRKRILLKNLNNSTQIGSPSKANLKVVVRVRPENERELNSNAFCAVDVVDSHLLIFDPKREENDFFFQGTKSRFRDLNKRHSKEKKFMFERIFDPLVQNEEVFEHTSKDIIATLLQGFNCSVFAYGATGSGKTFTMIGNEANPGITFLTVMELYRKIEEDRDSKDFEVGVSYLEVYNEMVRDLLIPGKPLSLQENGKNVQVTGLSRHKPKDAVDLLNLLSKGNLNRSQHPTDANAESSRSHAVFQVFLSQRDKFDVNSGVTLSKLSMIDLAGSERGSSTGFKGSRFREGANINRSLLALGNCINSLADGRSHIPYRDSKLTRLLKDSLGGNCRSVMIATITKSSLSFEDSFNTLKYATRAKTIKMSLKKNVINVDQHLSQYTRVVEDLKLEVHNLRDRLRAYEEKEKDSSTAGAESSRVVVDTVACNALSNEEREQYEETIQKLRNIITSKEVVQEDIEAERNVLDELYTLNSEMKNNQRELLQLETTEKEIQLKLYNQRLCLIRMNIFAFASVKIKKGVAKSERSIQAFCNHLEYIKKRKELLNNRLEQTRCSINELCRRCVITADSEDSISDLPEFLHKRLKENEVEQRIWDYHQMNEYFQSMIRSFCSQRANDEKLLLMLLVAVKELYLKLSMAKARNNEIEELMENIYLMLDESRVEWADLKNTDHSFREEILSRLVPKSEPAIEVTRLTDFSSRSQVKFSPVLEDSSTRLFKRSNLRKNSSKDNSRFNLKEKEIDIVEEKPPLREPEIISSTPFSCESRLGVVESENQEDYSNTVIHSELRRNLPQVQSSFNDSPIIKPLIRGSLHPQKELSDDNIPVFPKESQYSRSKMSARDSLLIGKNKVVSSKCNLNNNNRNLNFTMTINTPSTEICDFSPRPTKQDKVSSYSVMTESSYLPSIEEEAIIPPEVPDLEEKCSINVQQVLDGCESPERSDYSSRVKSNIGNIASENLASDIPEVKAAVDDHSYCVSSSNHSIVVEPQVVSSPDCLDVVLNVNETFSYDTEKLTDDSFNSRPIEFTEESDEKCPMSLSETFSVNNGSTELSKFVFSDSSTVSSMVMKNVQNINPLNCLTEARKEGGPRSMMSSNRSLSKLISGRNSSSKSTSASLIKRSVSGSCLPNAYPTASSRLSLRKEDVFKKMPTSSRAHFSSSKNKENLPFKPVVAFGSTFSSCNIVKPKSQRSLNFRSPSLR